MALRTVPLLLCLLVLQAGCSSVGSTMLTRDESNQFWTRKGNLKGVPITLKVPTHVQLTIFERHFLMTGENNLVHRVCLPFLVRDFSQEFIYSEKIFTVDFKRPAAGLYNLHLDLTDDQYIAKVQHDITDTTIQEVTALVTRFFPSGIGARTVTDPAQRQPFEEVQSVVAVGMFEIDAPDFEVQMMAFVNFHLNHPGDAGVVSANGQLHPVGSHANQQREVRGTSLTPKTVSTGELPPPPLPRVTMPRSRSNLRTVEGLMEPELIVPRATTDAN
jgi:hypothetical protein